MSLNPYPPVTQFETRRLELEREYAAFEARRAATGRRQRPTTAKPRATLGRLLVAVGSRSA